MYIDTGTIFLPLTDVNTLNVSLPLTDVYRYRNISLPLERVVNVFNASALTSCEAPATNCDLLGAI